MPHARSTRRRLLAAATTVLAVTLGAGTLTTLPASAADTATGGTASRTDATNAAAPIPFPKDARLTEAGLTGFFSRANGTSDQRWTHFADGSSRGLGWWNYLRSSRTTDYLVSDEQRLVTLKNLSTDATLKIRVGLEADGIMYAGSAGHAAFTKSAKGTNLRMHRLDTEGGTVDVTGLPADATSIYVAPGTPEDALVTFTDGTAKKWGLLDLATGALDEIHDRTAGSAGGDIAVSEKHVAWTEGDETGLPMVFLLDRATDKVQVIPIDTAWTSDLQIGLVGGWVVYGEAGGISNGDVNPLYALTAYDPATGAKVKLLDHLTSSAAAPDGLYVRGGSVAQGEGLYKITTGADGAPAVGLVATTGEPTHVVIGANDIPATVDLDQNGGKASFTWAVSRTSVEVNITLRHVRTGLTREFVRSHPYTPSVTVDWNGQIGPDFTSAYNGDYTWQMTARPLNGIGPATSASGTFKVTRKAAPHDYDDNGSPDMLSRDASGTLWRSDTYFHEDIGQLTSTERTSVGTGWNGHTLIEAAGNLGGAAHADIVGRDTAGVLWLYLGNGDGTFATRYKVGSAWNYNKIAAGSDLNGDGKADLVATDSTGAMWLHKGTGDWRAPFESRVKISTGWNGYNQITATGDIAGGAAGDLVARDPSGVLWLYLGNGDGTFATRVQIGSGWGEYTHLVGIGDGNRDGRADLVAVGPKGQYFYQGTGNWRAPLGGRQLASLPYVGDAGNHVA
ncbi:FG-GAP repeat domain-containing protein [Streptomyces sp. NPDC056527]|uniref:FG-GAP repeat domain-containing protein n=1 Tax=Streptomyces sp. NPDC056527 TaxID=3345853 RepID=UPI0036B95A21